MQLWDFFQETQERVRNNRGKRAVSVRATEGLLYSLLVKQRFFESSSTHGITHGNIY